MSRKDCEKVVEYYKLTKKTQDAIVGVINLDPLYFKDEDENKELALETIAKMSRNALLLIVRELLENIPSNDFESVQEEYKEGVKNDYGYEK